MTEEPRKNRFEERAELDVVNTANPDFTVITDDKKKKPTSLMGYVFAHPKAALAVFFMNHADIFQNPILQGFVLVAGIDMIEGSGKTIVNYMAESAAEKTKKFQYWDLRKREIIAAEKARIS